MRYQKIESAIWHDEKFIKLTPMQQRLFFYILTCPHGNLIGCFVLKRGYIIEDLKYLPKSFDKDFRSLSESGLIYFDKDTQTILIKNFLKHNPITNPNQQLAATRILKELPKSPILKTFLVLNEGLTKVLPEGLTEVLLKPDSDSVSDSVSDSRTEYTYTPKISPSEKTSERTKVRPSSRKVTISTSLPENFVITEEIREWAKQKGFDRLEERLEHFKDWATANAKKYVSWDAAFRNAVRQDWAKLNGGGNSGKTREYSKLSNIYHTDDPDKYSKVRTTVIGED